MTPDLSLQGVEAAAEQAAQEKLRVIMGLLEGEHPAQVYTAEGYDVWLKSVVRWILSTYLSTSPSLESGVPPEMRKLLDMLRPTFLDTSDGDRHWAEMYVNFTVGPMPEWEVEWTGFNEPGYPNVCASGPTLAEACQKCIDAIESERAALAATQKGEEQ